LRFYEAYWAPLAGKGPGGLETFWWMVRQIPTPIAGLLLAPWRERPRLLRSVLYRLEDRINREHTSLPKKLQNLKEPQLFRVLLEYYEEFQKANAVQLYPKGDFNQFLKFIGEKPERVTGTSLKIEDIEDIKALARAWYAYYRQFERMNLFLLLSAGFLIILILIGVAALYQTIVKLLSTTTPIPDPQSIGAFFEAINVIVQNVLPESTLAAVNFFLASVIGGVINDTMGDVKFFTTYHETKEDYEKRKLVLDEVSGMMRHVLLDPDCERVTVVAHSLGSAVAYDVLLHLGRENRSYAGLKYGKSLESWLPLNKIQHFITLASPIDKIHYFFEGYQSQSNRYGKIVTRLRGDLAFPPFAGSEGLYHQPKLPHTHWIAIWDRADPISGPVHTPNIAFDYEQGDTIAQKFLRVDNLEVSNLKWPNPALAHGAYLSDTKVIELLFDVIVNNKLNFAGLKDTAEIGEQTLQQAMQPQWKKTYPWISRIQDAIIVVVWLLFIALLVSAFTLYSQPVMYIVYGILLALSVLLFFIRWKKHPLKLEKKQQP
jgi:hypothetical protein